MNSRVRICIITYISRNIDNYKTTNQYHTNMKIYPKSYYLTAGILLLAGCSNDDIPQEPGVKYPTVSEITLSRSEKLNNDGLNAFGMQLFNEAAKKDDDNLVISPTSMALCVSMVANACDKATEQSIVDIMGCEDIESVNTLNRKLMQFLPDKKNKAVLTLANSIWHKEDISPSEAFKSRISDYYFGDVTPIDFSSVEGIDKLNRWCSDNTNNNIDLGFKPMDETILMICLNTLYFQGEWAIPFDPKNTDRQTFSGVRNDVEVEMMHNTTTMHYSESEAWESVIIPYNGSNSMIVFLPKEGHSINEIATSITNEDIIDASKPKIMAEVILSMPKFAAFSSLDLTRELKTLGVNCKPGDLGNFSGTSTSAREMNINFKLNTCITTDEKGSVAASAGAGIIGDIAAAPSKTITFTLDQPFIYVIRNATTGSVLVAGRYSQPTSKDS